MMAMEDGKALLVKLDSGEDFFTGLERALAGRGGVWVVQMGIGMLKDAEIGYFDGSAYDRKALSEPREVVAMHGTVVTEGGFQPHIHVGLAGKDHVITGGHLFKGTVCVVCEMALSRMDGTATRKKDPATGLNLLTLG